MTKLISVGIRIAAAFLGLLSPAMATPILWNLSGVTFEDGGRASGSFAYDAGTGAFAAWSISVVGGTNAALPTFTYDISDSKNTGCVPTQVCFDTILATTNVGDIVRQIGFVPLSALTDAGGSVGISLGYEQSCSILAFSSPTSYAQSCNPAKSRAAFSGLLTAQRVTVVPEPNSLLLVGAAGFGMAAALRRRHRNSTTLRSRGLSD